MDSDDLDLSLSPIKKSAPAKGRRANHSATKQGFLEADDNDDQTLAAAMSSPLKSRPISGELFLDDNNDSGTTAKGKPPPHGRRTGGWADETARAKTAKSVRTADFGGIGGGSDDDDDGPAIPDLDDVRDEDMAFQVADAPSVAVNRVATYKELDSDLLKHVAFATLDDLDLKLLTKRMAPESALKEADEPWNWDVIFAEVSGELQKEWYPEEDQVVDNTTKQDSNPIDPARGVGPNADRPYTAFNRFPV